MPAHGIPAPECLSAPLQREGNNVVYKWTIPGGLGVKTCSHTTGTHMDDGAKCWAASGVTNCRICTSADDATNCVVRLNCIRLQHLLHTVAAFFYIWLQLLHSVRSQVRLRYNITKMSGNQKPGLLEGDPDVDMGGVASARTAWS